MLEFREAVREAAERSLADSRSAPTTRALNRAEVTLIENQLSRGVARGHEFLSDEPVERGGTDQGPSPLEYLLASLGFCQEVMLARNVAILGLKIEHAHIGIKGYFDRSGGRVEGVENRGFEEIKLDVDIVSPEPPGTIIDVMRRVDRECYALNTLRRAALIRQTLTLNGRTIATNEYGPSAAP